MGTKGLSGKNNWFLLQLGKVLFETCYGWNCVPSPNTTNGILSWDIWEIMRFRWGLESRTPVMDSWPHKKSHQTSLSVCPLSHVRTRGEGGRSSVDQEHSSHWNPTMLAPSSQSFGPQNWEKINFCCLGCMVFCYDSLSRLILNYTLSVSNNCCN